VLCSEAAGAQIKPPSLTADCNGDGMYVGQEIAVGTALGMADIMAKLAGFAA